MAKIKVSLCMFNYQRMIIKKNFIGKICYQPAFVNNKKNTETQCSYSPDKNFFIPDSPREYPIRQRTSYIIKQVYSMMFANKRFKNVWHHLQTKKKTPNDPENRKHSQTTKISHDTLSHWLQQKNPTIITLTLAKCVRIRKRFGLVAIQKNEITK